VAGRLARGLAADPDELPVSTAPAPPGKQSLTGGVTGQLDPGLPAAGYTDPGPAGDDGVPSVAGGTAAAEDDFDLYGTGAVPDWTGKPGSDVLGDAR
jgi:hypothetical protein